MVSGAVPASVVLKRAPIWLSGSVTRRIGRLLRDSSPVRVSSKPCPANSPQNKRIEVPEFENGGTHVNVSGMALTKAAPHREDAVAFMEFLASDTAQEIYAESVYEYPVNPDVPNSDLVDSWGEFTADDVNLMELARLRPDALRITQEVDYDG